MFAIGTLAFYPSLGYNLLRNYLQPSTWAWFNRVDEGIIVGALPFRSMVEELRTENVGGIVCCVEEFETNALTTTLAQDDWHKENFKYHSVPMQDFTGSTTRQNLHATVEFIEQVVSEGKSVYIHCKAGRTRSATVAVSYLMKKNDWTPNVAFEHLKTKRPQVLLRSAHWRTTNEYRRFLDGLKRYGRRRPLLRSFYGEFVGRGASDVFTFCCKQRPPDSPADSRSSPNGDSAGASTNSSSPPTASTLPPPAMNSSTPPPASTCSSLLNKTTSAGVPLPGLLHKQTKTTFSFHLCFQRWSFFTSYAKKTEESSLYEIIEKSEIVSALRALLQKNEP